MDIGVVVIISSAYRYFSFGSTEVSTHLSVWGLLNGYIRFYFEFDHLGPYVGYFASYSLTTCSHCI